MMLDNVLLRILPLAGMLLFSPAHSAAQPVGLGMNTVGQGRKTCTQQSEDSRVNGQRSYLNLELKLSEGGSFEVTRAAEVPGSVRLNSAPTSDYIYEVSHGRRTVAAAFIRDDPFAIRGFADPTSAHGEKIERLETATVIVNIPAFGLSMLEKCKLGLRLYRLRPDIKLDSMDANTFLRLREEGNLTPVLSVPASSFTEAIKKAAKLRG